MHVVISTDINECTRDMHNCTSELLEECSNTDRSYECICQNGYYRTTSGLCIGESLQLF